VPNAYEGVRLSAPATVGGLGSGWGNVIAGNGDEPNANGTGILVQSTAGGSVIQGNTIGLGVSGVALGNGYSGITIVGADGVTIGNGPNANGRNIISGNPQRGIQIQPNGATQAANVTIVGNWIGTNLAGTDGGVGNGDWGIVAEGTSIAIGGDGGGDGNRIVGNGFRQVAGTKGGIAVVGAASTVKIWSNRIHDNNGLGIDLGYDGNTANDVDDGDAGPNGHQNSPTLGARVNSFTGEGYLRLRLDSHPGVYRIEVFTNTACDASGRGEGQQLLIWSNRTVPAFGDLDDVVVLPAPVLVPGQILTATATDAAGKTSEFSDCITVATTSAFYWSPAVGGNGHFYEYVNTPTSSWNAANLAANSSSVLGRPGRLVTIASAAENTFVMSLRTSMKLGDMRAWIGLRDLDGSNTWDWVTGEPFTYSNWGVGEPNFFSFEHWTEFFASGLWNNVHETFELNQGYVIEYQLPAPQELLVSQNLGGGAYSASATYPANPTTMAFDGDLFNQWNAGNFPTQWIEVNLQQTFALGRVRLHIEQSPNGQTTHQVWISNNPIGASLTGATLAHTFSGSTVNGQVLEVAWNGTISARYVQIRTTSSPSYVAWREVQVSAIVNAP
jgi:hypothetical protein